jgi:hypothetical protein
MIPYESNRLYAVPQTLEKRLEIASAIRKLFGQDDFKKASPGRSATPWMAGRRSRRTGR